VNFGNPAALFEFTLTPLQFEPLRLDGFVSIFILFLDALHNRSSTAFG
jgi:hypothetical protein